MRALLALGIILALSIPALAIEPGMEKCWSDTLYRQYDCPAVGWPYGTITQEQALAWEYHHGRHCVWFQDSSSVGGPIFIGKDWPVRSTCYRIEIEPYRSRQK